MKHVALDPIGAEVTELDLNALRGCFQNWVRLG